MADSSREEGMDRSVAALSDALTFSPKDPDSLLSAFDFVLSRPGPTPKNTVPGPHRV